jgi:hypothetical protein
LSVIANLLPRQVQTETLNTFSDLTDDELALLEQRLAASRAGLINQLDCTRSRHLPAVALAKKSGLFDRVTLLDDAPVGKNFIVGGSIRRSIRRSETASRHPSRFHTVISSIESRPIPDARRNDTGRAEGE